MSECGDELGCPGEVRSGPPEFGCQVDWDWPRCLALLGEGRAILEDMVWSLVGVSAVPCRRNHCVKEFFLEFFGNKGVTPDTELAYS